MQDNELFLIINPEFSSRFPDGINKLYDIFSLKKNLNLHIVNKNYLENYTPQEDIVKTLIIVGGDGTIHHALNSIPNEFIDRYEFGIIPAGTANEFSKLFSIPNNIESAANIILNSSNRTKQRLGIINNNIKFVTGLLYGVEAEVLKSTPKVFKHAYGVDSFLVGNAVYVSKFLKYNFDMVKVFNINGKTFCTNYLLINNANLKSKGLKMADCNNFNDFCIIYVHSKLKTSDILRLIVKKYFKFKILTDSSIVLLHLPEISLRFKDKLSVLVDGEPYSFSSPISIKLLNKPISVIST